MRATVTVLAVCPRPACFVGFGVEAVCVSLLCIRVTLGATNFLRCGLVHQTLYILVAIHAGKKIAVDGMLHLAFINKQANLLAVYLRCQRGIGVAGKAVFVSGLLLGVSCADAKKQE